MGRGISGSKVAFPLVSVQVERSHYFLPFAFSDKCLSELAAVHGVSRCFFFFIDLSVLDRQEIDKLIKSYCLPLVCSSKLTSVDF